MDSNHKDAILDKDEELYGEEPKSIEKIFESIKTDKELEEEDRKWEEEDRKWEEELKELEEKDKVYWSKHWVYVRTLEEDYKRYLELLKIVKKFDLTDLNESLNCKCKMCKNMHTLQEFLFELERHKE